MRPLSINVVGMSACTALLPALDAVVEACHQCITVSLWTKKAGKIALAGCRGDGVRSVPPVLGEKVSARAQSSPLSIALVHYSICAIGLHVPSP